MNTDKRAAYLLHAGRMDYIAARELQRRLATARAETKIPDTLILLQHPHIYTLGRSGHIDHLLMTEAERAEKGVSVHEADRGGDITYHGPGQLVGYPILHLGRPGSDGRLPQIDFLSYLRRIEEVLIGALKNWGIMAIQSKGFTGVWVQAEGFAKIAAIGIKVDARGISQHGFALNVDPDLSYFDGIVPCGIHHSGVTSMARLLNRPLDLDNVAAVVADVFGEIFGMDWLRVDEQEMDRLLQETACRTLCKARPIPT